MSPNLTRRHFLMSAATAAAAPALLRAAPPSERVRVGVVGLGNQGAYNWGELAKHTDADIVSICDVDKRMTAAAREQFPKARFFTDFRKMIDAKGLDAVLCATPDHCHFHVTHLALSNGLHMYCEKPLTHTVWEARTVAELATKNKLVTQMGTQIHAGDNYRRVVEMVKNGTIGAVKEVHVWVGGNRTWDGPRPAGESVPSGLDWDLWLGPAAERAYSKEYVPFQWRRFWAFGGGQMADMACHHTDLPFWALDLKHPTKASAEGSAVEREGAAKWIVCKYEFPARGDKPAVNLTWYDGDKRPPHIKDGKIPNWGAGTLFVGEKGLLLADYGRRLLFPAEKFKGVDGDGSIPKSIGHHKEWVEAIKNGGPTTCNFPYSGALTEAVLLGVASYRVGKPLEWDATALKAKGVPDADALIKKEYRKGWVV
jgi:predicted dehydrogenase